MLKSLFFTGLLYLSIRHWIDKIWYSNWWFWPHVWVIVCWSLYLATCLDCFAYKYLENVLSVEELMEDMQEAIKSAPIIKFYIEYYHPTEKNIRDDRLVTHTVI